MPTREQVFVIAEIGSNFKTKQDCFDAIAAAIAVGADAAKFQLFSHKSLYGYDGIMDHALPPRWIPELAEECGDEIEFMCTPFSLEELAVIDPYVKRHKVASSDMEDRKLLSYMRKTGKPIILSTGGHTYLEVADVVEYLSKVDQVRFTKPTDLTLLYCESAYPSRRHNLNRMNILKRFGLPVGISDHSIDVFWVPASAVQFYGAVVVEKHFNPLNFTDTPDCGHALGTDDFADMVACIRARGSELQLLDSAERDMRKFHNKRETEHGFYRLKPEAVSMTSGI